jgi:hypothetical protein
VLARKSFDLKEKRYLFAKGCRSDLAGKTRNSGSSRHFAVGITFARRNIEQETRYLQISKGVVRESKFE